MAATKGTTRTKTRMNKASDSRKIEMARVAPYTTASRTRTRPPRARAIPTVIRHACPKIVIPRVAATISSNARRPDFVVKKNSTMSTSVTAALPERETSIRSNASLIGVITTNEISTTNTSIPASVLQSRTNSPAAPVCVASAPSSILLFLKIFDRVGDGSKTVYSAKLSVDAFVPQTVPHGGARFDRLEPDAFGGQFIGHAGE